MATKKITDEQFLDERAAGLTLKQIAEKYNMNVRNVEVRSARLAKEGHQHGNNHVARHVPAGFAVKGTSTMIREDGTEVVRWVKTDQDKQRMIQMMDAAVDAFASDLDRAEPVDAPNQTDGELLTLYPVFDLHIGALAHKHECGENYSTDLAEKAMRDFFDYSVQKAPASQRAVLLIGGDFLHSDGLEAVTPASGHILDQDSRYEKLVYVAIRAMRRAISKMLEKHEHVEIQILPGNHDQSGMVWLRGGMAAHYEDEPRVTVDISARIMHRTKFGKTLLGYTHGHTMKKPDTRLAALATDFRSEFGTSEFVYTHSGHFHHQTVTEHSLGIDEVHGAMAAKDAYSANGGWRSYRQAAVIVYSSEFGEVGRYIWRPQMFA